MVGSASIATGSGFTAVETVGAGAEEGGGGGSEGEVEMTGAVVEGMSSVIVTVGHNIIDLGLGNARWSGEESGERSEGNSAGRVPAAEEGEEEEPAFARAAEAPSSVRTPSIFSSKNVLPSGSIMEARLRLPAFLRLLIMVAERATV